MDKRDPSQTRSRKYVVARRIARWRVTYDEASIGTFDEMAEATRFACDLARLEAQAGVTTIVVVHAAVQEMHCFTPPAATRAAPRARLRLVGGAG